MCPDNGQFIQVALARMLSKVRQAGCADDASIVALSEPKHLKSDTHEK